MIRTHWSSKFELGHDRIDFEHRIFLDLIRNVSQATEQGDSLERILRLLDELAAYAMFHFVSEENIMLDCGYPDYQEHRAIHRHLLDGLREQVSEVAERRGDVSALVEFLFEWFVIHTTREDLKIARYLRGTEGLGTS